MSKGRAMRVLAMSGMGGEGEEGRYRGNGWEVENHGDGRYERGPMHERHGGMSRYRGGMDAGEYDEDDHEGGRGGYAGRFRHSKNQGKHETGEDDEDEVKLDPHKARAWVGRMKNSDGTRGERFKPENVEQLRVAHCPDCDKVEFWAAMNMMYSDYCEVAKKMNVDKPEFYACMAKAFLMDEDAGEGKLAKYMKYVAEK